MAERIRTVQRDYNNRLGLKKEDDIPGQYNFELPLKGMLFDKEIDMKLDRENMKGH